MTRNHFWHWQTYLCLLLHYSLLFECLISISSRRVKGTLERCSGDQFSWDHFASFSVPLMNWHNNQQWVHTQHMVVLTFSLAAVSFWIQSLHKMVITWWYVHKKKEYYNNTCYRQYQEFIRTIHTIQISLLASTPFQVQHEWTHSFSSCDSATMKKAL